MEQANPIRPLSLWGHGFCWEHIKNLIIFFTIGDVSILQLSDLPHVSWLGLVEVVSLAKALKLLAELQSESSAHGFRPSESGLVI